MLPAIRGGKHQNGPGRGAVLLQNPFERCDESHFPGGPRQTQGVLLQIGGIQYNVRGALHDTAQPAGVPRVQGRDPKGLRVARHNTAEEEKRENGQDVTGSRRLADLSVNGSCCDGPSVT